MLRLFITSGLQLLFCEDVVLHLCGADTELRDSTQNSLKLSLHLATKLFLALYSYHYRRNWTDEVRSLRAADFVSV